MVTGIAATKDRSSFRVAASKPLPYKSIGWTQLAFLGVVAIQYAEQPRPMDWRPLLWYIGFVLISLGLLFEQKWAVWTERLLLTVILVWSVSIELQSPFRFQFWMWPALSVLGLVQVWRGPLLRGRIRDALLVVSFAAPGLFVFGLYLFAVIWSVSGRTR